MARIRKSDLPRDDLGRLRAPGEPDEMDHLRGLGDRVDAEEAFALGLRLFDQGRLFEAYVHFATAWKHARDDAAHPADHADALRSLAQAAAGWCHVQRGNPAGAEAVLARARAGLRGLADGVLPAIDVQGLVALLDETLAGLHDGATPSTPDALPRREGATPAAGGSIPAIMRIPEPVKGAPDWLPPDAAAFDAVEAAFLTTARLGGYERVRTPIFEHTEVFSRGVGGSTDIVQKEMYTFADKGGRSLTLRPEGTAGVLRAALTAGIPRAGGLPVKYAYAGEFFRHERPQAGRQRQFNQVGIEALGSDDPIVDAEVVLLGWEALRRAGLAHDQLTLRMNSLGDRSDRVAYHERLNAFLDTVDDLPADVQDRRHLNPLRAFDSKAPRMAEVMERAPLLIDHINADAKAHHETVVDILTAEGIPLTHDPALVRGLDYYSRTTFEYQAAGLGAQNAVGGGGRYDGLAEDLGWSDRFPGIGWALGVDRTLLALGGSDTAPPSPGRVAVFVVATDRDLARDAFRVVTELRRAGLAADMAFDGRSTKAQFKVADRSGAASVVVLGPDEVRRGVVTVKDLRTGEQREASRDGIATELGQGTEVT